MPFPLSSLPEQHCVHDVIVIGAGAAGMGVALCASAEGARVLLVESTPLLGGTSALSAGTTWVPGTRHAAEVGQADSIETAESFLSRAIGDRTAAILRHGARLLARHALDRLSHPRGTCPFRQRRNVELVLGPGIGAQARRW